MRDPEAKSAKIESGEGNAVTVTIFGESYRVRADEDGSNLEELARYVDAKMRSLRETTGTAEPLRLAVLAALNVTEELFKLEKLHREERDEAAAATGEILRALDESLREPTQTSPALP